MGECSLLTGASTGMFGFQNFGTSFLALKLVHLSGKFESESRSSLEVRHHYTTNSICVLLIIVASLFLFSTKQNISTVKMTS